MTICGIPPLRYHACDSRNAVAQGSDALPLPIRADTQAAWGAQLLWAHWSQIQGLSLGSVTVRQTLWRSLWRPSLLLGCWRFWCTCLLALYGAHLTLLPPCTLRSKFAVRGEQLGRERSGRQCSNKCSNKCAGGQDLSTLNASQYSSLGYRRLSHRRSLLQAGHVMSLSPLHAL